MFFFGKKETCSICNANETRKKLADGFVCDKCLKNSFSYSRVNYKNLSKEKFIELLEIKKHNEELFKNFKPFLRVFAEPEVQFDDNLKLIFIKQHLFQEQTIVEYKDILSFEVIEDDEALIESHGVKRAIAGGILLGGIGAVVGAVTGDKKIKKVIKSLKMRIIFKEDYLQERDITFIKKETKKDSLTYKGAAKNCDTLAVKLAKIIAQETN